MFLLVGIIGYVAIPLVMVLLFRKSNTIWITFSFMFTAVVLFYWPIGLMRLDAYVDPPSPGRLICGNPIAGLFLFNILFFIPIALAIQYQFLKRLLPADKR